MAFPIINLVVGAVVLALVFLAGNTETGMTASTPITEEVAEAPADDMDDSDMSDEPAEEEGEE